MATIVWLSIYRVHIGATWRIRLNHPCAAAMRHHVKLGHFHHLLVSRTTVWPGGEVCCHRLPCFVDVRWTGISAVVRFVWASAKFECAWAP